MRRYSKNPQLWARSKRLRKVLERTATGAVRTVSPPARAHKLVQRLDAETVSTLVADYQSGMSSPQLQVKYQLSKGSVLRLLASAGVEMRRKSLSSEQLALAVQRYRAGLGIREVAAELGVAKTTVQNALARSGIEMRPGGRRRRMDLR